MIQRLWKLLWNRWVPGPPDGIGFYWVQIEPPVAFKHYVVTPELVRVRLHCPQGKTPYHTLHLVEQGGEGCLLDEVVILQHMRLKPPSSP